MVAGDQRQPGQAARVVLVLSGGLGPTEDDLTREAVAEALGRPLEHHEDLLEAITRPLRLPGLRHGRQQPQAGVDPAAGRPPSRSPARRPGFHVWHGRPWWSPCPGVPWELKQMWQETVEPVLRDRPGRGRGRSGAPTQPSR